MGNEEWVGASNYSEDRRIQFLFLLAEGFNKYHFSTVTHLSVSVNTGYYRRNTKYQHDRSTSALHFSYLRRLFRPKIFANSSQVSTEVYQTILIRVRFEPKIPSKYVTALQGYMSRSSVQFSDVLLANTLSVFLSPFTASEEPFQTIMALSLKLIYSLLNNTT